MGRKSQPWWWKARKGWYVTLNGVRHHLGDDRKKAHQKWHELEAKPEKRRVSSDTVVFILDTYLDWLEKNKAPNTYKSAHKYVTSFVPTVGLLRIDALRPHHLTSWIGGKAWSDNTKHAGIVCVQAAFRHAMEEGMIDANPIAHVKKPPRSPREIVISENEYTTILKHTRCEGFRDMLEVAWETGARAAELVAVEARHIDAKNSRWIFDRKQSKGKRRQRIVYVTPKALVLSQKWALRYPKGPIFRRESGEPFTPDHSNRHFKYLQRYVGRKICLTAFRHTVATRLLMKGVDAIVVATLLGHVNVGTLALQYQHVSQSPTFLLEQLKRGAG